MLDLNNDGLNHELENIFIRGNLRWWATRNDETDAAQPIISTNRDLNLTKWIEYIISTEVIDISAVTGTETGVYQVADVPARDALSDPVEGDIALILDSDGSGTFGVSIYDESTGWSDVVASPTSQPTIYNSNGTVSGNRTVDVDSNDLAFDNTGSFSIAADLITLDTASTNNNIIIDDVNDRITLTTSNTLLELDDTSRLVIDNSFLITDSRSAGNRTGIQYASDYSADFIDNTLVTKKYVDDQISGSVATSLYTGSGTIPASVVATITNPFEMTMDSVVDATVDFKLRAEQGVTNTFGTVDGFFLYGTSPGFTTSLGVFNDSGGDPASLIQSRDTGDDTVSTLSVRPTQVEISSLIDSLDYKTQVLFTGYGGEMSWKNLNTNDESRFEVSLNAVKLYSDTRVLIVTDDLAPVGTSVNANSLLQLTVDSGTYKGHVQYTVNQYPTSLPGTDSMWLFKTDGTGEFLDPNTLISGTYLPLAGGTMTGDIVINGNLLSGSNGLGTNSLQMVDGSGAVVLTGSDTSDTTTFQIVGATGEGIITSSYTGFEGLKYAADYSGDYTARSLVDKAYVDNNETSIYNTDSSLSGDRTLTGAGNTLDFTMGSSAFTIDSIGAITVGDSSAAGNSTVFTLNDTAQTIDLQTTGLVTLGDDAGAGNSTEISINDTTQEVNIHCRGDTIIGDTVSFAGLANRIYIKDDLDIIDIDAGSAVKVIYALGVNNYPSIGTRFLVSDYVSLGDNFNRTIAKIDGTLDIGPSDSGTSLTALSVDASPTNSDGGVVWDVTDLTSVTGAAITCNPEENGATIDSAIGLSMSTRGDATSYYGLVSTTSPDTTAGSSITDIIGIQNTTSIAYGKTVTDLKGLYLDSTVNNAGASITNDLYGIEVNVDIDSGSADSRRAIAITSMTGSATTSDRAFYSSPDIPSELNGDFILTKYGSGSVTGTPTYNLLVDSTGLLIEDSVTTVATINTASTTTYNASASDYIIKVDASSNTVNVVLPDATTVTHRQFVIKVMDVTNPITVSTAAGNIDGSATYTGLDTQYEAITVVSDGTNYIII